MRVRHWIFAAAVLGLMTQFRCGLHGFYHEYGPDSAGLHHVVVLGSSVAYDRERVASVIVTLEDSASRGWLSIGGRFCGTRFHCCIFQPFIDQAHVQVNADGEWQGWEVGLLPPRVSEWP